MITLERRDDVAVVWMDQPGEPVNTLSPAVLDAFGAVLDEIERDGGIRGVVFASRKPDSFIAGADLRVLQTVADRRHPEHESILQWAGGEYDPDAFDPNAVVFDNPRKRWRTAFEE